MYDVIIDTNNRFSVLFGKYGAEEDHTFNLDPETEISPNEGLTLEERRYRTQAESNVSRKKMGYPPKGKASIDSEDYARIARKAKKPDAMRICISKIFRPLFEWRREFLVPYRQGLLAKEKLTIVPQTLIGVYEQWYREHLEVFDNRPPPLPGGVDGIPRIWDGQPLWAASEILGISAVTNNGDDVTW
jgi:hypothetical protein